jgi:peptidoglycan-N-acetylglucosamine deacetylase
MLYSGISWSAVGYEVEVAGGDGRQAAPAVRFGTGQTDEMITYLLGLSQPLVTVVDSTNGVLDGRMMALGLDVYRADPPMLPERPLLGSVTARDLAQAGQRQLSALTKLERGRGTQTGREDELQAQIAASAAAIGALTVAKGCVSHGPRDRKEVSLTFDDGPLPPYTGQILDILESYGACATFFCVGLNASAHTGETARMRAQGHALGNHTWSHPFLPELSRPQLIEQIDRTRQTIAEATGGRGPALFRPPYGSRTPEVVSWLAGIESTIVLWDVEAADWALPGADAIAEIVLGQARAGSVVLLHDGGGDRSQTVAALPAIIEGLLERGFRFVLVDDLVRTSTTDAWGRHG